MDLAYLFRVILKRKWIIIGATLLASLVAWFLTRNQPKIYLSTARFSTGFAVPDEIKVNESNYNPYDADIKFSNAINTWTSPSVISLLSYTLILHDLNSSSPFRPLTPAEKQSSFYTSIDPSVARKVFQDKLDNMSVLTSYKPDERALLEYLALYGYSYKYLSQYIQVFQVQRTDYIEVDCKTENPELSAFIVNSLFDQFIRYYRNIRSSKSNESIDTLRSIMEKKKQVLEDKNKLLASQGLGDVASENQSNLDLINEFERSLNEEIENQTDYNYKLRGIDQKLDNLTKGSGATVAVPSQNNNEELIQARKAMNDAYAEYLKTNDKAQLNKYKQLEAEYYSKFSNSTRAAGDDKVPDTKSDLLEKKNDLEAIIQASKDKIKDLQSKISALRATVNSSSSKNANGESLLEEAKLAEKDYFDANQRLTNALDMGSSSVNNFRQLQVAQPAIEPEPSKRIIIVGMAGAITFMTAVLLIVLLTYLDSSIRTPGIFARLVNLKLISMVNFMTLRNKSLQEVVMGKVEGEGHIDKRRSNVFRESIRKLRYEIEHSGKQIFLFTSTQKGQGKTTLIMAVSYSLCMSRKNILIIDTNFCNNDLTMLMHAEPVLEKISEENKAMSLQEKIRAFSKGVPIETGGGKLFIIGSQGGDYTPSEILPRENLLSNLRTLLPEFDYIFLEGPPLNDFSDSKELVGYVDGVVAIFSASHIIKQIDKESVKFFKDLNGKFTGSVLNMVDLENVNVI
jgi:polysaccharide biosynthesis transport protein